MDKFLIVFLIMLLSCSLLAQNEVNVVDWSKILSKQKNEVDSLCNVIEEVLTRIGREHLADFQNKYIAYQKLISGGCLTEETTRRIETDILKNQSTIDNLGKFITDTLPKFKENLFLDLENLLAQEVKDFAENQELSLILDAKDLMYYNQSLNLTDKLIEYINDIGKYKFVCNKLFERIEVLIKQMIVHFKSKKLEFKVQRALNEERIDSFMN